MSTWYPKGKEGFLGGEIVWRDDGSVIKASWLRGYTYGTSHRFVSDVLAAGGVVVATATLTALTRVDGVLDAADTEWEPVPEGEPLPHILIYQASAVTGGADLPPDQQRLIVLVDRGPGIPALPNGQKITSAWSPGADRIARW